MKKILMLGAIFIASSLFSNEDIKEKKQFVKCDKTMLSQNEQLIVCPQKTYLSVKASDSVDLYVLTDDNKKIKMY